MLITTGLKKESFTMLGLSMEIPTSKLKEWSPLCDLDFVLAHKVLNDSAYAQHFQNRRFGREVILDNSTHEFGKPLPYADLEQAAQLCRADYLIAPDIVNTDIDDAQIALNMHWMHETCENVAAKDDWLAVGAVLCGHTRAQRDSYISFAGEAGVTMLCFTFHEPKRLLWFSDFMLHPTYEVWNRIHILGVSTLAELRIWVKISEQYPEKQFSVDTSKALKFGVQEKLLTDNLDLRGGPIRSKEVLELGEFTPVQEECILQNIHKLKAICRGEE